MAVEEQRSPYTDEHYAHVGSGNSNSLFLPKPAAVAGKICSDIEVNGSCIFFDEVSNTF